MITEAIKAAYKAVNKHNYKDRGIATPGIIKAGFTKQRRRLEYGGKVAK